jgi:hypothetical protein
MDILMIFSIIMMIGITCVLATTWIKEQYAITSPNLRSMLMMLTCLTALVVVLFGTRLFLKPEVTIKYTDTMYDLTSIQSVNDKGQHIVDTKRIVGCTASMYKSYPLMLVMGRDTKTIKYKMPCEHLTPEMKTEVSNVTSFLKEEKQ